MLITLEGPEGGGKSTQARLLVTFLRHQEHNVVAAREPGGTPIGDRIRAVLHDPANTDMEPWTEVLLYAASRAQLVTNVIRPALAAGNIVVCDRYADSTIAYQGYGRGLDLQVLGGLTLLATGGLVPDLTLCLDIRPEQGLERRRRSGEEWNRLDQETIQFHRRVRAGYLELAGQDPARWVIVDASRSTDLVERDIRAIVERRMSGQ